MPTLHSMEESWCTYLALLISFVAAASGCYKPDSVRSGNPDFIGEADSGIRDKLVTSVRNARRTFVLVSWDNDASIGPFEVKDELFRRELADAIASSSVVYEKVPGRQLFLTNVWTEFDLHGDGEQQCFRLIEDDLIVFFHDERYYTYIKGDNIMMRLQELAREQAIQ